MKLILLRLDKIGDLISTLPVDQVSWLKEEKIEVQWVIAKGLSSIIEAAVPKRKYLELDLKVPSQATQQLIQFLKEEKPDAVVVFYAPWWVSYACWRAGVPLRVGRKSQWYSFFFFNKALRQSRSLSKTHEADFNCQLLDFAFGKSGSQTPFLLLEPPPRRHLFEKHALRPGEYFIVHPGMAGSALNWPQAQYNILIEKLINAGTVVITGTQADEPYLNEIRPQWQHHDKIRWLQDSLSFEDLLSLLRSARGVVAPSTGVLHLAACMLQPKVVGLYSPVRAHSATRWGPRGPDSQSITPEVDCPATQKCWQDRCPHHPCMEQIKVNLVLHMLGL